MVDNSPVPVRGVIAKIKGLYSEFTDGSWEVFSYAYND